MQRRLFKMTLHGEVGKTYGTETIEVYAKNVQEVFSNLVSRFGETFKQTILEGAWHITQGSILQDKVSPLDKFLEPELVDFPIQETDLHLFPAIVGAGGKGVGQIILGVVLIVVAVVVAVYTGGAGAAGIAGALTAGGTATSLAIAGVVSIAGGVSAMLTKSPKLNEYSSNDPVTNQKLSFIFNGVVNNTEQGVPIPLVYGKHLTGSTVISAGIEVYRV